jgi:ATP-dependent protease HslVU (ClpYQ) peptidase subunit
MRNWIIGAAAILALAVPGVAAAQTGYVGVVYGNADAGTGDDTDFYGAEGAVAFAGSGSIVFEVDASFTDADEGDEAYGLVGHVYARNDNHLFGGFVGIAGSDDSETFIAGLEANKYFANWTLAGAVAYGNNDDADADGYGVNVEARFFVHDNFRIDANAGWANVAGDDEDATTLGIGGEYQFAAAPISVRAGYSNTDFDGGDVDVWSIGLRYNWGGTLRDRDRNGASQASLVGIAGL